MERRTIVVILVAVVVIGLGYLVYIRYGPQRPETVPEAVVEEREEIVPVVSASGTVLPARWAQLSFKIGGRVEELAVEVGDEVVAGQLLARLDSTELEHAVAQAEAGLALAQANLAQVKAGAREEEIAAAEEAVAAAQANLEGAEASLARLLAGASEREIEIARLAWEQAKDALWAAQAERDGVAGSKMSADYAVDAAEAAVLSAEVAARIAELQYEGAKAGPTEEEVRIARAQVDAAKAQVEQAKAQLALLRAGPTAEAVAAAEAQVKQAEAALAQARSALEDASLRGPFDGTVTAVSIREGEMVAAAGFPVSPVITIGDLGHLRIETTDLSEMDIARVKVGQEVAVTFDALPEKSLRGRVSRIAPMATLEAGGTNYTVTIELEETDPDLRWGMTAFVDIITQ